MLLDRFADRICGATASDDGVDWRIDGDRLRVPPGARHASVPAVDDETGAGVRRVGRVPHQRR